MKSKNNKNNQLNLKTMYKKTLTLVCIALLIISCKKQENNSGDGYTLDLDKAIEKAESRRKADPNASGGNKCLLGYANRFNELLTQEEVLEATGFSAGTMEIEYSRVIDNAAFHRLNYQFDNKRERTVAGYTMPFKDNVQLQRIKAISLTQFKNAYRAITEEENKMVKEVIDDIAEGNASGTDAKEAQKQLDASDVDTKVAKDAMGTMADAFKEISKGYRNVEGLGDAAVWNAVTKELVVLDNGVQFEIQVDAKSGTDEDKNIAIALAKRVLNKCK